MMRSPEEEARLPEAFPRVPQSIRELLVIDNPNIITPEEKELLIQSWNFGSNPVRVLCLANEACIAAIHSQKIKVADLFSLSENHMRIMTDPRFINKINEDILDITPFFENLKASTWSGVGDIFGSLYEAICSDDYSDVPGVYINSNFQPK